LKSPIQIKYIKLDQFIPNWTEMVKEMDGLGLDNKQNLLVMNSETIRVKYAQQKGMDFMKTKFCLVGEGHKYNDWYSDRCSMCDDFCGGNQAGTALIEGGKTMKGFKLKLYTHFLESHPEFVMRK